MKYEWKNVFIVQNEGHHTERVFGTESEAQAFCDSVADDEYKLVIDEWPVQFEVKT